MTIEPPPREGTFRDYWIDSEMMIGGKEKSEHLWNYYAHLADSSKLQCGHKYEKEWLR